MASSDDLRRLGAAVRAARARAGLTIDDVADQGGMSPTTWGRVERGEEGVRRTTYSIVERVLGWQAGSVERILAGGEPTESPGGPEIRRDSRRRTDYIAKWLEQILEEIWSSPTLPDEVKEELATRARLRAAEAGALEDRLRRTA